MNLDMLSEMAPYICSFLTGLLSYFASRHKSKQELNKLKLEWEHQSTVQYEQEFNDMCRKVYALYDDCMKIDSDTVAAVAIVRSKAAGSYAQALDELLSAVNSTQRIRIAPAMRKVIAERSKLVNNRK